MIIDVIIEIPKKSNIKYEYDLEKKSFKVDRILYGANVYPQNYGFIDKTLDWDGDPLDVLVISDHSFIPGTIVPTRILGAMKMIDNGETDTKLIGVIENDIRFNNINKLQDLNQAYLNEIQDFFENYKNLQKKKVEINGFEDEEYAIKEINITKEMYLKYKDMKKESFIELMKSENPNKYK